MSLNQSSAIRPDAKLLASTDETMDSEDSTTAIAKADVIQEGVPAAGRIGTNAD